MARFTLDILVRGINSGATQTVKNVSNSIDNLGTGAASTTNTLRTTERVLKLLSSSATDTASAVAHLTKSVALLSQSITSVNSTIKTMNNTATASTRAMAQGFEDVYKRLKGLHGENNKAIQNSINNSRQFSLSFSANSNNVVNSAKKVTSELRNVHSSLHEIVRVAAGVLLRDAIRGIYHGILNIANAAVSGYMNLEKLTVALSALATKQFAMGEVAEVVTTSIYQLTQADIENLQNLQYEYELAGAKVVYLQDKMADAIATYGDTSYQVLALTGDIQEAQDSYSQLGDEIANLQQKEGQLVTTTEQVIVGTMSSKKAMELAAPLAKELALWVEELSLTRPLFSEEVTSNALQLAGAFNFTLIYASELNSELERMNQAKVDGVVTAQRLVLALQDFISASGLGGDVLERLITALGQVKAKGRLAAEEVRQFVNANLGLDSMARAMGVTIPEFQQLLQSGSIAADDFILHIVELFEKDFGGASEAFSSKLIGIRQGFANLLTVLGRRVVAPFIEYLLPALNNIYKKLRSSEFRDAVSAWASGAANQFILFIDKLATYKDRIVGLIQEFTNGDYSISNLVIKITDILFPGFGEKFSAKIKEVLSNLNLFFNYDFGSRFKLSGVFDILKYLSDLNLGFKDNLEAVKVFGKALLVALGGTAIIGVISFLVSALGGIFGAIGVINLAVAGLYTLWETNWLGIRDTLTEFYYSNIEPVLSEFVLWLRVEIPIAVDKIKTYINDVLVPAITGFIDKIEEFIDSIKSGELQGRIIEYVKQFEPLYNFLKNLFDLFVQNPNGVTIDYFDSIYQATVGLREELADDGWADNSATGALAILYDTIDPLLGSVDSLHHSLFLLLDLFQGYADVGIRILTDDIFELINSFTVLQPPLTNANTQLHQFNQTAQVESPKTAESVSSMIEGIGIAVQGIIDKVFLIGEIYSLVGAIIGQTALFVIRILLNVAITFSKAVNGAIEWLGKAIADVLLFLARQMGITQESIDEFISALQSKFESAAGSVRTSSEIILSALTLIRDILFEIVTYMTQLNSSSWDLGSMGGNSTGTGGAGGMNGSGNGGASAGAGSPLVGTMIVNNPAAAATVMQQLRNARYLRNALLIQ